MINEGGSIMGFLQFHRTIKIRIIESSLSTAIGSMVFPFMAIYFSGYFSVNTTGLLLLINGFIGIAMNLYGGYFSDRFGRKKLIVVAELLRFLAFMTMMVFNSPWFHSPLITFLMFTIHTICSALIGPANQAMLIDVSKPDERKLMYTIMYWANNMSIALGGILGGLLFKEHLFELFIALSATSLIALMLITLFIEESFVPANTKKTTLLGQSFQMFSNYLTVFRDKIFIVYLLAGVLILSMEFQLGNYISIRLAKEFPEQNILGLSIDGIGITGILRAENTILVVIFALFITKMISRFNDRYLLFASWSIFVGAYAVISYTNHLWILFITMFVASIAELTRVPIEQSYLANLPPDHSRSSYLALSEMRHNLSRLICSITVAASAFLSNFETTILITSFGGIGILMLLFIAPALEQRVRGKLAEKEEVSDSA